MAIPEDDYTTNILAAEGFQRAFHQIPNVPDHPALWELRREEALKEQEEQEDEIQD